MRVRFLRRFFSETRQERIANSAKKDAEDLHLDKLPNRDFTVFIADNSHVIPSNISIKKPLRLVSERI